MRGAQFVALLTLMVSMALVAYVYLMSAKEAKAQAMVAQTQIQNFWKPAWPPYLGIPAYELPPLVIARHSVTPRAAKMVEVEKKVQLPPPPAPTPPPPTPSPLPTPPPPTPSPLPTPPPPTPLPPTPSPPTPLPTPTSATPALPLPSPASSHPKPHPSPPSTSLPSLLNSSAPVTKMPSNSSNSSNSSTVVSSVPASEVNSSALSSSKSNMTVSVATNGSIELNVTVNATNVSLTSSNLSLNIPVLNGTMPPEGPIPVLGVSVFVNADLLERLLNSIDYPVERIVVIHNGRHPGVATVLDRLRKEHPDWTIESHPENVGCAGAWNRVLAANPDAPYHIISNDDIRFYPGALKQFHLGVLKHIKDLAAGRNNKVILYPTHGNLMSYSPPWSCFAILKYAVDTIGKFDENFWPVYHEDYDYMVRMARADIWQAVIPQAVVQHGWAKDKYEPGMDRASKDQGKVAVLEEYKLQQKRHERGSPYYALKWGAGETPGIYDALNGYWNKRCTMENGKKVCQPLPEMLYAHPFNDPSLPLSFVAFDPALRHCFETGEGAPCRYNASLLPHPDLVPHDTYDSSTRRWRRDPAKAQKAKA